MTSVESDSAFVRFGVAVLAVMLTAVVNLVLEPLFGEHVATSLFVPAVLGTLFYAGVGPGYFAAILATVAVTVAAVMAHDVDQHNILRVITAGVGFFAGCAMMQTREKRVRGSLETLRSALAGAADAIVRMDRHGRIAFCDDRCRDILGASAEGMKNRAIVEIVTEDDRSALVSGISQCWREGKADVDARILWRGVAPTDFHLALSRIDNAQGRPDGMMIFMNNVSERKRQLEELRQSRERLELAFRHGIVGMTVSDMEGTWLEVNAAFCELVGYVQEELVGRHSTQITHPGDRARDAELRRQMASGEIDHCVTEKRCLSRSGQSIWVRVSHEVVHDQDGKPEYVISQIRELSLAPMSEDCPSHDEQYPAIAGMMS